MVISTESVRHADLTPAQLAALRDLFDREYRVSYGDWDADRPYGYSPADIHVIARDSERVVGHIGYQVRSIGVGRVDVIVAGVGGVLVDPQYRSIGLGRRLMQAADASMLDETEVPFGYLGCRESVVPFYEGAGWSRVRTRERSISRADQATIETAVDTPILVRPIHAHLSEWPVGDVDLRGTPW